MTSAIWVDSLKCDLLHLTDRATVIGGDLTFVYLADDEWRGRDTGLSVREDDLRAVSDWLGDWNANASVSVSAWQVVLYTYHGTAAPVLVERHSR